MSLYEITSIEGLTNVELLFVSGCLFLAGVVMMAVTYLILLMVTGGFDNRRDN